MCSWICSFPLTVPWATQENRKMYHSMVTCLDDNLANITGLMKAKGMWENTLMVLSSDNGGYVKDYRGGCNTSTGFGGSDSTDSGHGGACFNGEAGANNFPLRYSTQPNDGLAFPFFDNCFMYFSGGKYAMFEGGIRVNAFVSGGVLPESVRGTKLEGMIHIVDCV